MSVDNYFRQHGYSLQYVRKAPKNSLGRVVHSDRVLNADKALSAKNDLPVKASAKQVSEQTQAKQSCTHEAKSQRSLQGLDSKVILLKHLRNVETHFYCSQAFLYLDSSVGMTSLIRHFGIKKSFWTQRVSNSESYTHG